GVQTRTTGIHLFSAAWAQAGIGVWTGLDVAMQANQAYKAAAKSVTGKFKPPGYGTLKEAGKTYDEIDKAFDASALYDQWMGEFDAMEQCHGNPTQTITQNAYRDDPAYQQQTLDAIADARSQTTQATALRFVNQDASVAMQLNPPSKNVAAVANAMAKWNDAA